MPGWLYMSKNDTGTIWEGWEGPKSQAGIASLNHYSKGAMVEWPFKRICGIQLDLDDHFTLEPVVGGKETYLPAHMTACMGRSKAAGRRKTVMSSMSLQSRQI